MGKNYKILINPAPPDPEKIKQYQDFDALMKMHEKEPTVFPLRSARLLYISSAIAACLILSIAYVVFFKGSPKSYETAAKAYFASQPYVNPPLKDIEVQSEVFSMDAESGDTLTFQSGSMAIIPSDAFVDDSGKPLQGKVDIEFIEMVDFIDFFISGIPMTYDSNDVQYQLESAGMIEIIGKKNGKKVNLAPGKVIEVALVSEIQLPRVNVAPPKFNVYHLNPINRQWEYFGKDNIEIISEQTIDELDPLAQLKLKLTADLDLLAKERDQNIAVLESQFLLPPQPIEPVKQELEEQSNTFFLNDILPVATVSPIAQEKIDNLSKTEPQIVMALAPNSAPIDNFLAIDSATIDLENEQLFNVTFYKGVEKRILKLFPVLSEASYKLEMEAFEQANQAYETAIKNRDAQIKGKLDATVKAYDAKVEIAKAGFQKQLDQLIEDGLIDPEQKNNFKIINRFQVNAFGIWNCDRPIKPSGKAIKVKLLDQNGNRIINKTAFLVNQSTNTIYKYLATNNTPINYQKDAEFLLWVVGEDNKLSVLNSKEGAVAKNGEELILKLSPKSLKNEEDVRSVLYF